MKSILKNILLLFLLFALGTVLLGLFNPGVTVEGDDEYFASVGETWDIYLDTSTWNQWWHPGDRLEWGGGRRVNPDAQWAVYNADTGKSTYQVEEFIKDSLVVFHVTSPPFEFRQEATFHLDNGQTNVSIVEEWTASGFLDNIRLNFRRGGLEKNIENRLKRLKEVIQPKKDKKDQKADDK